MITAVMLHWKREKNAKKILRAMEDDPLINEAIVWNNRAKVPFRDDWATVIESSRDMSLTTRFAAAALAKNTCVLIQDDDLLLPQETVRGLFQKWLETPDILHGLDGRGKNENGEYANAFRGDRDVPIVLTRALLMHRRLAGEFFAAYGNFEDLLTKGIPRGNGEDIVLNYVAQRLSGRWNRIHNLPRTELPDPHAIHRRSSNHNSYRTQVMRRSEEWLAMH